MSASYTSSIANPSASPSYTRAPVNSKVKFNRAPFLRIPHDVRRARPITFVRGQRTSACCAQLANGNRDTPISAGDRAKVAHAKLDARDAFGANINHEHTGSIGVGRAAQAGVYGCTGWLESCRFDFE